ncbi:MAG: restriction endonuclease [Candidatus Methanomethylicia archaeon]|nr:restriction endonuclease [Candidatus Methanomethylicia archaeon]
MKSSYVKGRNFEYTVRMKFAKRGYLSIRSSSSRGTPKGQPPIDVIAIKDGRIIAVECKKHKSRINFQVLKELVEIGIKYGVNVIAVHSNGRITCIIVYDKDNIVLEMKNIFENVKIAKIGEDHYELIEV